MENSIDWVLLSGVYVRVKDRGRSGTGLWHVGDGTVYSDIPCGRCQDGDVVCGKRVLLQSSGKR